MAQKTVDECKFLVKSVGIGFELIIFTLSSFSVLWVIFGKFCVLWIVNFPQRGLTSHINAQPPCHTTEICCNSIICKC